MTAVVFDTNIWIGYQPRTLPRSLHMSVVVLQERLAGAADATDVKNYEAAKKQYEREGKLLVPNADDWIEAWEGSQFPSARPEVQAWRQDSQTSSPGKATHHP